MSLSKKDLERFRLLLTEQRHSLTSHVAKASDIRLDPDDLADEMDTASSESDQAFAGRLRERERGLLNKIAQALEKIEDGVYGECEDCGEDIAMARLEARPVADLCIDCKSTQEKLERLER
jgi:DnaK suppressor protein